MKYLILFITFTPVLLIGQSLKTEADTDLNQGNFQAAITKYQQYLKGADSDSSAWFNLGRAQIGTKDYDAALQSLEQAATHNFNAQFVGFNQIKVLALQKRQSALIEKMESVAAQGLVTHAQILRDNAFDRYRGDDDFQKALAKIEINAYPCLSDENARHFDFWLGDWEVFAQGRKAGENKITRAVGGCAIHENYKTAGNYAGQSINYYDPVDKKWHQHWVGSSGDVYNFLEIDKAKGTIQFQSRYLNPQGQINWMKMTFTENEDGSVRQFMENSSDEGQSWTTAFDGLYKRKAN